MAVRSFSVKLFEIDRKGRLEGLLDTDEDYFAGTIPDVGDTFAKWGLDDVYTFFSVQRRIFVESPGDDGWLIIVRQIESAPLLDTAAKEWIEDTRFWREVDEQERLEELAEEERRKEIEAQRKANAPRHHLHPREVRALRFMIDHPECVTIDAIPQAGEYTLTTLAAAGLVRTHGRDERGVPRWQVTKEGCAEIARYDLWTARRKEN